MMTGGRVLLGNSRERTKGKLGLQQNAIRASPGCNRIASTGTSRLKQDFLEIPCEDEPLCVLSQPGPPRPLQAGLSADGGWEEGGISSCCYPRRILLLLLNVFHTIAISRWRGSSHQLGTAAHGQRGTAAHAGAYEQGDGRNKDQASSVRGSKWLHRTTFELPLTFVQSQL